MVVLYDATFLLNDGVAATAKSLSYVPAVGDDFAFEGVPGKVFRVTRRLFTLRDGTGPIPVLITIEKI